MSPSFGAMRIVPSPMPTALAATALVQLSPNVIGNQPNTITENARLPPKNTAGLARRSVSSIRRLPRPPART